MSTDRTARPMSILIIINYLNPSGSALGVFQKIMSPLQEATYNFGSKIKSILSFESKEELEKENQELEEKLKNSRIDQIELSRLKEENKFLKEQLNFLDTTGANYKIAKIIAYEIISENKILILNQGKNAGLKKGYPTIISGNEKNQGYLIGKIIQVEANIAKLLPITAPRSSVAAKILNTSKTTGLLSGERGLTLKMDLIPKDQKIKKGDLVITSGLENEMPEGLILGEVEEVTSAIGDFFSSAKVNPQVDFETLRMVTVILP